MLSDRNGLGRVAVLSGIAYFLLSTASAPEELAPQNADVASGQQVFNNICRMNVDDVPRLAVTGIATMKIEAV